MNIAMITNNYKPFVGGVPISIERLSDSLIQMGHNVYIFAPKYSDESILDDEYIIRYKSFGEIENGFNLPNILDKSIADEFDKLKIDVIHAHHPIFAGDIAKKLSKKYDIPIIYTYHTRYEEYIHDFKILEKIWNIKLLKSGKKLANITKHKTIPWFIRSFSENCNTVIAPSNSIKERLVDYGVKEEKITVVPTGLQEHNFMYDDEIVQKIKFQYKQDKKYMFCTVTRLTKEKNLHFLIDAMKDLKLRIGNNFVLMIIGEGPLKEELLEKIDKCDLSENIVFTGKVRNDIIANYYRASDLFVFSSTSETQGMVLSEAMAQDVPVVAVKSTGIMDVIQDSYNGFATNEDIRHFTSRIIESLSSKELYNKLKNGASKTANEYKCENIAEKIYIIYYKSILSYKRNKSIISKIFLRKRA